MAVTKGKKKSAKKADKRAAKRPRLVEEIAEEEAEDDESEESREPLNLKIDEDGRVCNESGSLTRSICFHPPVRVYDDFVSADSVEVLRECCEKCSSTKQTFWSDWGQAARCDLEALALAILSQHCPEPAAAAGVEWWTSCIDADADEGWHWNRDCELEEDPGINVHPMLGTITYLSAATSPPHVSTIALDVLSPTDRDEMHPVSILGGTAACIMVPPKPGRHFVFDGRFLHGAPLSTANHALPDTKRVTLMANIWVGRKPSSASPLPVGMHVWSRPDLGPNYVKSILPATPVLVKPMESPVAPAKDFSCEGGTLTVSLPIPPSTVSEMSVSSALAAASWSRSKKKAKEGKAKDTSKGQVMDGARGPDVDVIIVGAGASGVGVGTALVNHFGISQDRMLLLERGAHVGTSFRLWPKEMRFISPSFNQHSWTRSFDLNSIASGTSPAISTSEEHPTGEQYASYLEGVARDVSLPIRFGVDVTQILPVGSARQPRFEVHVKSSASSHEVAVPFVNTVLRCRFVIWAAGEFQYPKGSGFPGAELCCHNSTVRSWASHPGEEFVVIGGYESGIDAAVNLASTNRAVTVLASSPCWDETSCDPSAELAPHTRARLKQVMAGQHSSKLKLFGEARVTKVEHASGKYSVHATHSGTQQGNAEQTNAVDKSSQQEAVYVTPSPPILGIGFEGSIAHLVKDLFDWKKAEKSDAQPCMTNVSNGEAAYKAGSTCGPAGSPILTLEDESTKTKGLFLVGPQVSHEALVFCFVYKFRQRFAVVAAAVAKRLGKDTRLGVSECRSVDMFLDDFTDIHACCGEQDDDDDDDAAAVAVDTRKHKKKPAASETPRAAPRLQKKPAGARTATKKLMKKPAGSAAKR